MFKTGISFIYKLNLNCLIKNFKNNNSKNNNKTFYNLNILKYEKLHPVFFPWNVYLIMLH